MKCSIYPEKVAKLNQVQMLTLIKSMLQHISRSVTYSTGPVELSNRVITELVEIGLIDIENTGCGGCSSCAPPAKAKRKSQQGKSDKKQEGNLIKFPVKK